MTGGPGDDGQLATLYREVILAHAAKPHGHGVCIEATHEAEGHNPLCGDQVLVRFAVDSNSGRIEAAAFDGEACAICMASASLLCEHLPGRDSAGVSALLDGYQATLTAGATDVSSCPDFLVPMLGVKDYPARVACATLPWRTALDALNR